MKKINVYVAKTSSTRTVWREDGTAYQLELWSLYDSVGKVTERGRREVEQPWLNRDITVDSSTLEAIQRSFHQLKGG